MKRSEGSGWQYLPVRSVLNQELSGVRSKSARVGGGVCLLVSSCRYRSGSGHGDQSLKISAFIGWKTEPSFLFSVPTQRWQKRQTRFHFPVTHVLVPEQSCAVLIKGR